MRRPRAGARRRPDVERDARSLTPEPVPSSRGPATSSVTSSATRSSSAVGTPATEGSEPEGRENHSRFPSNHRFPRTRRPAPPAGRLASKDSRRNVYSALEGREITYEAGGPEEPASAEQTPRPTPHEGYDVAGGSTSGWLARASASARAREMPAPDDEQARAARLPLVDASRCTRQERLRRARLRPENSADGFSFGRGGRVCRSSKSSPGTWCKSS
jgi:hypothetical protein